MARPPQDAIDTFINVTGASEAVAIQTLEEYNGDLNRAIDAHFNEGDRTITRQGSLPMPAADYMNIDDDPVDDEPIRTTFPSLPPARDLNPFSLLDPTFRRSFLDGRGTDDLFGHGPQVSHPRDVRQIPIEFKDDNGGTGSSGLGPRIEEVTGREPEYHPEVHGTVIIDDDDDDDNVQTYPINHGRNASTDVPFGPRPEPSAPYADSTAYSNDIEEEMVRAAIEASKREAELHASDQTAEQERTLYGLGAAGENHPAFTSELGAGRTSPTNGRQLPVSTENGASSFEQGTSFAFDEAEEEEEQPLVRHRSRHVSSGPGQASSPQSSSPQHNIETHPVDDVDDVHAFQTDEWAGISSAERDEAVMLEAAMFGGIPEGSSFPFAFPPQAIESGSSRNSTFYPRMPRPPSPRLTAERLLREQQDDEYLAALQADQEKEMKAREEEELRLVEEAAAREAALGKQRQEEEEKRRKQLEEEELEKKLAAKEEFLPQEPSADDENAVTLLVRMPDGSRRGRRFLKSDKLQFLFDYIDIGRVLKPGSYRLVRPYPRRAFTEEEGNLSLSELGLSNKQEALFLETI